MMQKITREEFGVKYKKLHDSIFSGRLVYQHPFENLEWATVLLPGRLHFPHDVFSALSNSAKVLGDQRIILTDIETIPPHQDSVLLDWNARTFKSLRHAAPGAIGAVDADLFGLSCRWGMICYYDDFSCMGGDQQFMDRFTDERGTRGRQATISGLQ